MWCWIVFSVILVLHKEALGQNACRNPAGQIGTCIPLRNCNQLYALLQKRPVSDSDRQLLARSQCGWKDSHPLVCCDTTNTGGSSKPSTPSSISSNFGAPSNNQGLSSQGQSLLPAIGVCGSQTSDRIVGGERTLIDEHPWMVLLEYRRASTGRTSFNCGGTLINKKYILTAAHCIKAVPADWRLISVRLGEWDLNKNPDCDDLDCAPPPIDVPVESVIVHENYAADDPEQYDDIALIRLSRNVEYTSFIKPVCLPVATELRSKSETGLKMEVVGWGRTETRSQSDVKLKVSVTGVDNNQCATKYVAQNRRPIDKQICAGGLKGKDSCQGDSGGGLFAFHKDTRGNFYIYQAGVVSYGPTPCGQAGWPGVYTRVSKYIDWITKNLKP